MLISHRTRLAVLLIGYALAPGAFQAQSGLNPYGHWEGAISAPSGEIAVEIDLAQSPEGKTVATFSSPPQHLKGLPLANVSVEGRVPTFEISANGGGVFECALADDSKSMGCEFAPAAMNVKVPLTLTRTGEARIETVPRGAKIAKELEGTWQGAIESGGGKLEVVLKLANQADGTSTGVMISVNQSGIELPVKADGGPAKLTLEVPASGGSWSGSLNSEGTELIGTFREQGGSFPLNFRRATGGGK